MKTSHTYIGHGVRAAARLSLGLAIAGMGAGLAAQEPQVAAIAFPSIGADVASEELERAFWICDQAASKRSDYSSLGGDCGAVADAVKERKFGNDFGRYLAWWEENKTIQRQKFDTEINALN